MVDEKHFFNHLEETKKVVEKSVREEPDEVLPHAEFFFQESIAVVPILYGGPDRERYLRTTAKALNAWGVVTVMEAYMGTSMSQADLDSYKHGDLAKDPKAQEVVVMYWECGNKRGSFMAPIERGDKGRSVGEWVSSEGLKLEGRLTHIIQWN